MNNKILVIDDEPDIRQLLAITLSRMDYSPVCVENINEAFKALKEHEFQLCLTDLKLPDGSGLLVVEKIQNEFPLLPVIVITAHGSMDIAISAMKYGAFDFINKPVDLQHLRRLINNATSSNQALTPPQTTSLIPEIIGKSEGITLLKERILKVSRSQAPVFIVGESGSGKELVARSIHVNSARKNQPFIAINCGAIPAELMESEFFGHTKGSFTGAHHDKQGLFQAANGGTLFLDEVADLPLDMQVKLLRAIQEKKIRPIGSAKEESIDVRILSATHQDLSVAVEKGGFRSDLFYRINVIEIPVPPLRDRLEDIQLLCSAILKKIALQNKYPEYTISNNAINTLKLYNFPGNIRELENILERACTLSETSSIEDNNLLLPQSKNTITQSQNEDTETKPASTEREHINTFDYNKQSIDDYLNAIEKEILLSALEKNRWHRTTTAKMLGITFRSLRYRLKKLNLDTDKGT